MECYNKWLGWVPFFSICSVFIVLGTIGWLFGVEATPLALGLVVMGALTTISNFFPPEFNFRNYWYTGVALESHFMLMLLAAMCSVFLIFFVAPKYEVNFNIKKRGNE